MNDMKNTNTRQAIQISKPIKWTSYKEQQAALTRDADMMRHERHIFVCHIIIAACTGASVALGFALVHQIFFA